MKMMLMLSAKVSDKSIGAKVMGSLKIWQSEAFKPFLISVLVGLIMVFVLLIALKIILKSTKIFLNKSNKFSDLMVNFILKIISALGWVLLTTLFLQQLGVDMVPLVAGIGVTGIILGLAFQDSLSNFFAGAMLVLNDPFRKGDFIEVGSLSGSVASMDLMCITLNTPDGKRITLSNNLVWGVAITNYSYTSRRAISIVISVTYDSDLVACKELFLEVFSLYPEVLKEPSPTVEVHKFSHSSIDFLLRPWVKPEDYWKVYWRFQGEIVDKLKSKGIKIPFKQIDAHVKDKRK